MCVCVVLFGNFAHSTQTNCFTKFLFISLFCYILTLINLFFFVVPVPNATSIWLAVTIAVGREVFNSADVGLEL